MDFRDTPEADAHGSLPPALEKVRVRTRTEQVADQLSRYIESAGLGPGSRLPGEATLAEQFGVSRPVVREAMRNLTGQGVIEVVNGRGAIVRPLEAGPLQRFFDRAMVVGSDDTVIELQEVRRGLETTAAALAAERRSEEQAARLTTIVDQMADHLDDDRYIDLDVDFHVQVAGASGNLMIGLLLESVRGSLHNAVSRGLQPRPEHADRVIVQKLHERVLRAIVARRPAAASKAMAEHFDVAIGTIAPRHE